MAMRKPIVLVLCTGNSCRSQMAEGFLRKYQGERYEVHSAGTHPADRVHPLAVRVMQEAGVDISGQRTKGIDKYLGREAVRHVLIVCDKANSTCPRIWPGTYSRDSLPFEDPAEFEGTPEQKLGKFREVRDEISAAMKAWMPSVSLPTGARR
jgi:arsenate reductase (thioredoxin)